MSASRGDISGQVARIHRKETDESPNTVHNLTLPLIEQASK